MVRLALAIVLCAVVMALISLTPPLLVSLAERRVSHPSELLGISSFVAAGFACCYVVFGLPAHALLTRFDRRRMLHYVGAGVAAGLLLWATLGVTTPKIARELSDHPTPAKKAVGLLEFAGLGAVSAGLFWLVGVRSRTGARGRRVVSGTRAR